MKRIGIFAGTFDPIHNGHMAFAQEALATGLDMVYFLPEPRPRRKQGVRSLMHRQAMISAAIAGNKHLGLIKLEQARFTSHETLPVLQNRFPGAELTLLFGDDVLHHIADWPRVEELVRNVGLLIATRHSNQTAIQRRLQDLAATQGLAFQYQMIDTVSQCSSSQVRDSIRSGAANTMITPAVASYIRQHRLYRPRS
jgi:nicotinate-nucleotide adenylyltransferase